MKNTQRTLMTGYQLEDNIYQVRHKGPSMWKVELKTGEVVLVPKALAQKYLTQDPESSKSYM